MEGEAGMSTSGSPYGDLPPTEEAAVALDVKDPHEHHWFAEPTEPVTRKYVSGLVFAQFVFFVALLGPAIIGIGVKVQQIVPDDQKTSALGTVAGFGTHCSRSSVTSCSAGSPTAPPHAGVVAVPGSSAAPS